MLDTPYLLRRKNLTTYLAEKLEIASTRSDRLRQLPTDSSMHDESLADHESHDEFFGNEAEGDSESDEPDNSSDDGSSAQRIYHSHGAASAASVSSNMPELETVGDAEEEFLSESEDDDGEVSAALATAERPEQTSALVAAEVSDMMSLGCGCQGTNHSATWDKEGLESLMISLRELEIKSLKLYILGELAVSIYPKAAGIATLERRFKYSFMGIPFCKQAFWCILGVNERTMHALKKLAAEVTVRIVHGNLQRTPHNILSAEVIQSIFK